MDVQTIDIHSLELLSEMYVRTMWQFRIEPEKASPKKQKKIRKWIDHTYMEEIHNLPKLIGDCFSAKVNNADLLRFLCNCYEEIQVHGDDKKRKFENACQHLNDAIKSALWKLLQLEFWPDIKVSNTSAEIIVDDTPAFRRTVTLCNVDIPAEYVGNEILQSALIFKQEDNKFCFYGEIDDPVKKSTSLFSINFSNAIVNIEVFNSVTNLTFWENPWDYLRTICFSIGMKADLPGKYCNALELELLPLIREIVALGYWIELPAQDYFYFSRLKSLANQYEYKNIVSLLERLETIRPDNRDYYRIVQKLTSQLCLKKYEPLWREIYSSIQASQKEYPNKVETYCPSEILLKARKDIEARIKSQGYNGTYPDFIKTDAMSKMHLAYSYHMSYFVGMEKHVKYYIHCCESYEENDQLTIQFLCGTAFLKKEDAEDIYSCIFNAHGHRLYNTVHHYIPVHEAEDTKPDDLDLSINIAVKKAECKKLNKEERKAFYGAFIPGWGTFFWVFILGGGLFAALMTLTMLIICIFVTIVFGLFNEIPEMLTVIPWGWLFAFAWIGFGGTMGLIEVLARRK